MPAHRRLEVALNDHYEIRSKAGKVIGYIERESVSSLGDASDVDGIFTLFVYNPILSVLCGLGGAAAGALLAFLLHPLVVAFRKATGAEPQTPQAGILATTPGDWAIGVGFVTVAVLLYHFTLKWFRNTENREVFPIPRAVLWRIAGLALVWMVLSSYIAPDKPAMSPQTGGDQTKEVIPQVLRADSQSKAGAGHFIAGTKCVDVKDTSFTHPVRSEYALHMYECATPADSISFVLASKKSPESGDESLCWARGDLAAQPICAELDRLPPTHWVLISPSEIRYPRSGVVLQPNSWLEFRPTK